jgi:flagellar biosynthesis/type III secretory pathway protein FliH
MTKQSLLIPALMLSVSLIAPATYADRPEKESDELRKEQMKEERELLKKQQEEEREFRKNQREREREARKQREEEGRNQSSAPLTY